MTELDNSQAARSARASIEPFPGISAEASVMGIREVMARFSEVRAPLLKMADIALVEPHEGSTLCRTERELIATSVSANNQCFFCMDSHAAHAIAIAEVEGWEGDAVMTTEAIKQGDYSTLSEKMQALTVVALDVRKNSTTPSQMEIRRQHLLEALECGATQKDVDLAILIASAFSMFNRFVDGFGSRTPDRTEVYGRRAMEIALSGYSAPPKQT